MMAQTIELSQRTTSHRLPYRGAATQPRQGQRFGSTPGRKTSVPLRSLLSEKPEEFVSVNTQPRGE